LNILKSFSPSRLFAIEATQFLATAMRSLLPAVCVYALAEVDANPAAFPLLHLIGVVLCLQLVSFASDVTLLETFGALYLNVDPMSRCAPIEHGIDEWSARRSCEKKPNVE
jgi:hypothetical protein